MTHRNLCVKYRVDLLEVSVLELGHEEPSEQETGDGYPTVQMRLVSASSLLQSSPWTRIDIGHFPPDITVFGMLDNRARNQYDQTDDVSARDDERERLLTQLLVWDSAAMVYGKPAQVCVKMINHAATSTSISDRAALAGY